MVVDGFEISSNSAVYLIAEMSANHNGSIETAFKTIEAAKEAGANAIKLQTYTPDTLTIKAERKEFYLSGGLWDGCHLYDLYQDAHTPYEWHEKLFDHALSTGISIFSTPFDDTAVELLEGLDTPAYKIASFEIIDTPLIARVASTKKPIFMSTGAASMDEIAEAIRVARKHGAEEILLFHCVSSYPTTAEDIQLKNIEFLKNRYGVLVGLSDHTIGTDAGFLSVGLGAVAIEKHFTLDRSKGGVDAEFSSNPAEFRELRSKVDLAKQMLGMDFFIRSQSEKQSSSIRRSIYSVSNKKIGDVITRDDIKIIRPGLGMHPRFFESLIGLDLKKEISFGDPLDTTMFDSRFLPKTDKCSNIKLVAVVPTSAQINMLYQLLKIREFHISHKVMPTLAEHESFVKNHPYRGWWLMHDADDESIIVGSVYVCFDNSVGLNLNLDLISFTADYFADTLTQVIAPLPSEPSKRCGEFFYNISPLNVAMKSWFIDSAFCESQIAFMRD